MIKLRDGEKIIIIKRRHIFVLLFEMAIPILLLLFLVASIIYFTFFGSLAFLGNFESIGYGNYESGNIDTKYPILFGMTLMALILWQFLFISIIDYYLDCWIITNERTIHTELKGIFNRFYSSVPNRNVQDMTVDVKGFFPTILQYGNLHIQTAGSFKDFIFRQIPKPYETKDILLDTLRMTKKEEPLNEDSQNNFADNFEQWS